MTSHTFSIFGTEKFWGQRFKIVSVTAYAGLLTIENEAGHRFLCSAAPADLYETLALLKDTVLEFEDGALRIVMPETIQPDEPQE